MVFGGFRTMWVMVMFDLPVDTKEHRKAYTQFRKGLKADGFIMLQYSVYGRACPSEENATRHKNRVRSMVPNEGEVRILTFTDKQFERMEVIFGKMTGEVEKPPDQISFF